MKLSMIELLRMMKRKVSAAVLKLKLRREARKAFRYDERIFMRNAGALHLDRREAAKAEIVMGYHVLEKGLTMPHRRLGFGKGALVHLINLVNSFEKRFGGGDDQVNHAIAVLRAYRLLHKDWPEPMPRLVAFLAAHPDIPSAQEPHYRRDDFFKDSSSPFPAFAASRHVCRHFAQPIPHETIMKAIEIATTAPSACNRQHVRLHVIEDAKTREALFALQGGTRGFGADADKAIIVTADLSAVRWAWERHDAWTNGGIFVMNLCYALHYCKVAHCILHWSVPPKADIAAHQLLQIPENEAIVQVILCGMPPEEFDVAASPRRLASDITVWH